MVSPVLFSYYSHNTPLMFPCHSHAVPGVFPEHFRRVPIVLPCPETQSILNILVWMYRKYIKNTSKCPIPNPFPKYSHAPRATHILGFKHGFIKKLSKNTSKYLPKSIKNESKWGPKINHQNCHFWTSFWVPFWVAFEVI